MRILRSLTALLLLGAWAGSAAGEDSKSALQDLSPNARRWVDQSCPRSLGPSLWSACISRETAALASGMPDLSGLSEPQRNWVARTCPTSLGPSLYVACISRELAALESGIPDLAEVPPEHQSWLRASCPTALGPSLYRACLEREMQAIRSLSKATRGPSATPALPSREKTTRESKIHRYDQTVLQIQLVLKSLGFYAGAIDGIAGPQTTAAVRAFQSRFGLNPTGDLDATTAAVLLSLMRPRGGFGRFSSSRDCEGYNSDTGALVYGECDDGDFEGYDSETGNYVYGDCEEDGDLDAYDSETGAYVYGECE